MDDQQRQARSFGGVAEAYERGRPSYPRDAAAWLTSDEPLAVLELGAGTGKLTEQLVALGHDVHATDPDPAMLEILKSRLPGVRTSEAVAEEIPGPDGMYDVVVGAQCFHWFDFDRAVPEIVRVLKPGGSVALVWNQRDERIPWVRRLGKIIGTSEQVDDPSEILKQSLRFLYVETETFKHWQQVDRDSIQDLVRSRSAIAVLDEESRAAKLAELLAFYDEYGRGMDGMQLPYLTRCFRARVIKTRAESAPEPAADSEAPAEPPTDDDSGTLLIDFR
ncbi:MAG TPA: methyltransferase domain-containing protein [Nocardioides sp.]|nr:methyltransferase domain-containing protein [Nocardioides sp.]